MNQIAVKVEHLSRSFGEFIAVNDISFEVSRGEIFGFLGANGAGKTTTIRMLCGLLMPTSGKAWVQGIDIGAEPESVKQTIGYMSQRFSLYNDLTVEENITFYGGIYGLDRKRLEHQKNWMLNKLNLSDQRKTLTSEIPLGWKQRLALGCAILHNPSTVFLDEPTSGVDPISRRNFWSLIYELAEAGTTVFVTTHYMDEAEYCNRLSVMHQGKIITIDSPNALKSTYKKDNIEDVFVSLVSGAAASQ
ncbi:MAG: ABC transporter ATP-binding protein [Candidatus Zhuqueibacterota bacterium]